MSGSSVNTVDICSLAPVETMIISTMSLSQGSNVSRVGRREGAKHEGGDPRDPQVKGREVLPAEAPEAGRSN